LRARRHEEIFEECLSALLENRRSIDESLSLYPSLADHLEPLLRAALEVSNSLEFPLPPAEFEEESRRRFLALASTRTRERALMPLPAVGTALWPRPSWVVLIGAVALAVGVGAIVGFTL
jgi:hypothetical protein